MISIRNGNYLFPLADPAEAEDRASQVPREDGMRESGPRNALAQAAERKKAADNPIKYDGFCRAKSFFPKYDPKIR